MPLEDGDFFVEDIVATQVREQFLNEMIGIDIALELALPGLHRRVARQALPASIQIYSRCADGAVQTRIFRSKVARKRLRSAVTAMFSLTVDLLNSVEDGRQRGDAGVCLHEHGSGLFV
ncbi:MAG: hypothetical protein ABTS16_07515 [Candidatus Accumulibacter phosphatis]|uniref:hypothetical protein n=1 Tax=Candidatus Accumulibacter TaxID=327159 RepID=UPI0004B31EF5|nr:hypothetical protein [Accumulibacter sp.]HRF06763.1 hypothetical protein [Accumulibacter sp.]